MTQLTVFDQQDPYTPLLQLQDHNEIVAELSSLGIGFERWVITASVDSHADQETILAAYAEFIDAWKARGGYQAADVVRLTPDHPERAVLRQKFLAEHTHSEDEIRFFVAGTGTFFIPVGEKVYRVTCEQGDLLHVPANARHWFDTGVEPSFTAIRIFTNPDGWVGHFTGSPLAGRFNLDAA